MAVNGVILKHAFINLTTIEATLFSWKTMSFEKDFQKSTILRVLLFPPPTTLSRTATRPRILSRYGMK